MVGYAGESQYCLNGFQHQEGHFQNLVIERSATWDKKDAD